MNILFKIRDLYTNHQKYRSICSNEILGGTVFDYFDYFIQTVIIGTIISIFLNRYKVYFVSVIFTVDVLGIGGRQPAQARMTVKCFVI